MKKVLVILITVAIVAIILSYVCYKIGQDQGYNFGYKDAWYESWQKGNQTGYQAGYDIGYQNGSIEGNASSYIAGFEKGESLGRESGFLSSYNLGYQEAREKGIFLRDPTTEELAAFLSNDQTNRMSSPGRTTADFASSLNNNAKSKGIRAGLAYLVSSLRNEPVIYFNTTDNGLIFAESWSDRLFRVKEEDYYLGQKISRIVYY